MCTAVAWKGYFGRNLDLEYSYREAVAVAPRNYPFCFQGLPDQQPHYAMIGVANVENDYPLYYDAVNEKGLAMAGLNFPELAHYGAQVPGKDNVASFEVIPRILSSCANVAEAEALLKQINITATPFSEAYRPTPLHWMISDLQRSIVLEAMEDGLHIHENPVGVLTNNPPFPYHMYHLRDHMQVASAPAANRFSDQLELKPYSRGMGGIGLPGDFSSASRFVRAAFVKLNSVSDDTEESRVSQFFHILGSVAMPRGSVRITPEEHEITVYSSCCNQKTGTYYFTTYDAPSIRAVALQAEDLEGSQATAYPLNSKLQFHYLNR